MSTLVKGKDESQLTGKGPQTSQRQVAVSILSGGWPQNVRFGGEDCSRLSQSRNKNGISRQEVPSGDPLSISQNNEHQSV